MRLMGLPDGLKDYWKEWEVLDGLFVTVKEYHLPPGGFKSMKMTWDTGSFCSEEGRSILSLQVWMWNKLAFPGYIIQRQ